MSVISLAEASEVVYFPAEESLRDFQVEETVVGVDIERDIYLVKTTFPDLDRKSYSVLRILRASELGFMKAKVDEYGFKPLVVEEIDALEMQRFWECVNEYKLPFAVAAHLAFNDENFDLSRLKQPDPNVEGTVLVCLRGEKNTGKTTMLSALKYFERMEVDSFDRFSGSTVERVLDGDIQSMRDIVEKSKRLHNVERPEKPKGKQPVREIMGELVEKFVEWGDKRPSCIVVEGMAAPDDFTTDIVAFMTAQAMECQVWIGGSNGRDPWIEKPVSFPVVVNLPKLEWALGVDSLDNEVGGNEWQATVKIINEAVREVNKLKIKNG